jgi:hypothetical protein
MYQNNTGVITGQRWSFWKFCLKIGQKWLPLPIFIFYVSIKTIKYSISGCYFIYLDNLFYSRYLRHSPPFAD